MHDEENAELSTYLHTLAPEEWEQPSLCEGWRVRDVVGHILYGNELNLLTLPAKLARYGFSSDRSGKALLDRPSGGPARATSSLGTSTSATRGRGTCKVFPARLTLLDRLAHHQDIRRALGHPRTVPEPRLLAVLEPTPKLGSVFGARKRCAGLALTATDVAWSWVRARRSPGPAKRSSWPCWAVATPSPTSPATVWRPSPLGFPDAAQAAQAGRRVASSTALS